MFPGRLGTLRVFEQEFALPIAQGGWSNATDMQAETAYKCALVLRDIINPYAVWGAQRHRASLDCSPTVHAVRCRYLLRRLKRDVNVDLPTKTEQVLFCRLAPSQRATYKDFLRSREVRDVLNGDLQPFRAVGILRKICNHPDLPELRSASRPTDFGHWRRSGKMLVRGWWLQRCAAVDRWFTRPRPDVVATGHG